MHPRGHVTVDRLRQQPRFGRELQIGWPDNDSKSSFMIVPLALTALARGGMLVSLRIASAGCGKDQGAGGRGHSDGAGPVGS
jgi:hypothetical protein